MLHVFAGCLLALTFGAPAAGRQDAARADTARADTAQVLADAARAFNKGRYDELGALLAKLPSGDADAGVLRARAAIATGRTAEAERLLAPLAQADRGGTAALVLGELHLRLGRLAEAEALLASVLARAADTTDTPTLARAARAAHRLGRFEEANGLYRAASSAGGDAAIQVGWGELLLEKHQTADAVRSFRAALQADRGFPPAYLGLARAFADTNPPVARDLAEHALTLNPALAPAHVLLGELALDERDRAGARERLEKALAIDASDLDARAHLAAIAYLEDDVPVFERAVADLLGLNPRFGDVYRIAGEHAARHYRFDEAVALARRGVAVDPDSPRAQGALGMHLLRTGDEAAARQALDRAFRADPYDVVTYNLLGLLDTLESFVTVTDGTTIFRFHPDEAPILREHALPLARDALETLSARYRFAPAGPLLIEVFPRHDDFAVRNLGLPGMIGALGACFGRVVTLDSPKARPGTFNWQSTLWHELAHVITLQMSRQRVPRWLSEGVSVYEEQRARPEWGRDMRLRFLEAMNQRQVLPLAEIDRGFSSPELIGLAYHQSALLVEHIVARHGHDALIGLLRAYGEGHETPVAVRQALGVDLPALQTSFSAALETWFGDQRASLEPPEDTRLEAPVSLDDLREVAADHPRNYAVALRYAEALREAGRTGEAMDAYERADALLPLAAGEDSPLAHVARLAIEAKDTARAVSALDRLLARDDTSLDAARQLLTLLPPDDAERLPRAHARIVEVDPFDAASHAWLGRRALEGGEGDRAARLLRAASAAKPTDPVGVHCDLAEAYLLLGATADARRQTLAALEIAPTFPRAQDLLLSIVDARR